MWESHLQGCRSLEWLEGPLKMLILRTLGFKMHIKTLAARCFYRLRQLRSVRNALTSDTAKAVVHAFISNCVDYCNSNFSLMHVKYLRPLQSVLHAAARVISRPSKHDHICNIIRDQLHWLPMSPPVRTEVPQWNVSIRLGHVGLQKSAFCSPWRSGQTKEKKHQHMARAVSQFVDWKHRTVYCWPYTTSCCPWDNSVGFSNFSKEYTRRTHSTSVTAWAVSPGRT